MNKKLIKKIDKFAFAVMAVCLIILCPGFVDGENFLAAVFFLFLGCVFAGIHFLCNREYHRKDLHEYDEELEFIEMEDVDYEKAI